MRFNNKKFVFFSLVTVILILFASRFFRSNVQSNIENENQSNNTQSLDPKSIKQTDQIKGPYGGKVESKKVEKFEVKDETFDSYDKMEANWLSNAKAIIDETQFQQYLEMRDNCDKEKLEAYKVYHDYLRKKFGENFKYNLSEDQSILEKKINEKYLLKLSKLIGEDSFKKYLKARDNFNENLRKSAGENKFIIVEF